MSKTLTNASAMGGRLAFLPPSVAAGFRRATVRMIGLLVLCSGLALALALGSYEPLDPSLNHATANQAQNLLGLPGAHFADLLLQMLGLAAGLVALVPMVWGFRLLLCRPLTRIWMRLLLVPIAVGLAAAALTALPSLEAWPLESGLGGHAGTLLLGGGESLLAAVGMPAAIINLLAPVVAVLAIAVLLPALAVSPREWAKVLGLSGRGLSRAAGGAGAAARGLSAFLGRADLTPPKRRERGERLEPVLGTGPMGEPLAEIDDENGDSSAAGLDPVPSFLVEPRVRQTKPSKRATAARQPSLDLGDRAENYKLPDLDLLEQSPGGAGKEGLDEASLAQNARLLESVLQDFGVNGEIVKVRPGPVVTLYEFVPAPGTKSSRVIGLSDDIARSMSAVSVRVAVIPGRNVIGIELPNARREVVYLRELLGSDAYERAGAKLPLVLGKDIGGGPIIADLHRMPHLLVAGTTGSGKSVSINTMILSLLYRLGPDRCKFIMIDPKMLELSVYDGIPQLLAPVVTEPKKAVVALKWTVREMEGRYQDMAKLGVRNIEGYNVRISDARRKGEVLRRRVQTGFDAETGKPVFEDQPLDLEELPYIVVIVDEMADLMLVAGKDIEAAVQRLAQMARAAGIHLIMATQRPSVDVITGTIKANFPTRVSFQVTSRIDSRTILGEQGAETLLGQGDMLYMAGGGRITRVHGPFVTDNEVEDVVRYLKGQGAPSYIEGVTEDSDSGFLPGLDGDDGDDLYRQAVELVAREGKASTSFVQRHLQIGYNRAARLIERMEAEGLISAANHVGKREVLMGGGVD